MRGRSRPVPVPRLVPLGGIGLLTQQIMNGIAIGGIYAMIAVGFSLTYSILRFVNLAHGGMITIGAYAGFFLAAGAKQNLPVTVVLAGLTTGVVAVIAGKIGFRPIRVRTNSVVYFFISSMALSIIIENLDESWQCRPLSANAPLGPLWRMANCRLPPLDALLPISP